MTIEVVKGIIFVEGQILVVKHKNSDKYVFPGGFKEDGQGPTKDQLIKNIKAITGYTVNTPRHFDSRLIANSSQGRIRHFLLTIDQSVAKEKVNSDFSMVLMDIFEIATAKDILGDITHDVLTRLLGFKKTVI